MEPINAASRRRDLQAVRESPEEPGHLSGGQSVADSTVYAVTPLRGAPEVFSPLRLPFRHPGDVRDQENKALSPRDKAMGPVVRISD